MAKVPSKQRRRVQQESDTLSEDERDALLEAEQEDLDDEGADDLDWSKPRRVQFSIETTLALQCRSWSVPGQQMYDGQAAIHENLMTNWV